MKLYSHPLSLFATKVRIALAEKGLAYDLENVPLDPARGYQPKHPDVVRHNPKQQVPVLIDGDMVLFDSTVILEYLEDLSPQPALYPREVRARARCRLLELEADELAFSPIYALILQRYTVKSGAAPDPSVRARSAEAFEANCLRLNRQLGGAEFLCGEFSVADIAHFLVVCYASGFELQVPQAAEAVHAWFGRVASRPVVAVELMRLVEAARALDVAPTGAVAAAVAP